MFLGFGWTVLKRYVSFDIRNLYEVMFIMKDLFYYCLLSSLWLLFKSGKSNLMEQ